MTRSTPRNGLSRAAALVFALALGTGWAQSGPVLAYSTAEQGGQPASAPFVADSRFEAIPVSNIAWLPALHDQREDLRAEAAAAAEEKPAAKPVAKAEAKSQSKAADVKPKRPSYSGYNRFWIPSLGMKDRVHEFACTRSRDPDNYIYRWGCAGANNVYIMGHAYGVMKPLHDLYVRGGLRKGMVAIYADAAGRVHWYRVISWRVVDPSEAAWAIASQPVPSMTLQTCVGKYSQYRLNVRLVQFKVT
jgi:sortase (surface protein transpeptidase)